MIDYASLPPAPTPAAIAADESLAGKLLPDNATAFEHAHLEAQIEAWPLDVDAIAREGDPDRCGADKLPFLAFDKGLILWRDSWSEARKRQVVRDGWIYKRLEGTPLGVEAYLNLADGALIAEVLPPAQAFAIDDTGLTHDQVLELMPQLRLYHHFPDQVLSPEYAFADARFADVGFAVADQGELLGRYPVLYDPETGSESPLDIVDVAATAVTVSLARQSFAGSGFYADAGFADGGAPPDSGLGSFLGEAEAAAPIVFDLADPEMVTLRNSPDLRAAQAAADARFADDTYASDDLGDVGTYDRLFLYDGSRLPSAFGAGRIAAFADVSWLGLPPYWQILTAAIPGTPALQPRAAVFADAGFAFDVGDHGNEDFAMAAIGAAKRGGDRILIDLAPTALGTRAAALPDIRDI